MKHLLTPFLAALMAGFLANRASAADTRCYEMRVYYAAPGKLDALNARFRDHTCKLFEKHGMVNIGYWMPLENPEQKLVYVLAYPDREAREKSWKAFMADPEWQAAYKASEQTGKLVARAESIFLAATDFSPAIRPAAAATVELRTYTASEGNLNSLLARFRDHTLKLFEKYGMVNLAYWTPTEKKDGAGQKLIYMLGHASKAAAEASFNAFRADPAWVAARKASEEKVGGSLTAPSGVKSEFMRPTDYSPTK
jgi:hypothetical protein